MILGVRTHDIRGTCKGHVRVYGCWKTGNLSVWVNDKLLLRAEGEVSPLHRIYPNVRQTSPLLEVMGMDYNDIPVDFTIILSMVKFYGTSELWPPYPCMM